jgi:acetyl esterase/lipase
MKIIRWQLSILLLLLWNTIIAQSVNGERINIWEGINNQGLERANSQLIIFQPDKAISNGSSVIICPGGSYCYLGIEREGYDVAKWLNTLGYTAFVLKYRVGMHGYKYPAMIQDLQRAIEIVREQANRWNIDPHSLGVMGFSAGGHLVGTATEYYIENFMSSLGIEPKTSLRPDFTVMVYPVVSMHDSLAHKKSKRNLLGNNYTKELENKLSLEDNVHEGMPPIFIAHAKKDKTVDYRNSLYFYQNCLKKNLPINIVLFDCEGHGFGIDSNKNKEACEWKIECEKWLEQIRQDIIVISKK